MYKAKSCAGRKWKALAMVPTLALALSVTGVPAIRAAVSTISTLKVSEGKSNEKPSQDKTSVKYFKIVNVNNNDGKTTVVIKAEGLGNNLTVSGGTFTTHGKTYDAKSLSSTLTDGKATITAVFPFITEFDNVGMTLNINGEKIPFDLENFFNNASAKAEQNQSEKETVGYENLTIYLDGKVISGAEMQEIKPDQIASIEVDKKSNIIRITSK